MTTNSDALIRVENLVKHFGEVRVLEGISTEIKKVRLYV